MGSIGEVEVCLPLPVFVAAVKLSQEQSVDYIGADKHGDYKYGLHLTHSKKLISMKISLLRSGDSDGHFKIQIGDVMRVVAPSSEQSQSSSPHVEAVSTPERYIEVPKDGPLSMDKDIECLGTTFIPNPRRSLAPDFTGTRKRKAMGRSFGSLTTQSAVHRNKIDASISSTARKNSQTSVGAEYQNRLSNTMVNGSDQPSNDPPTSSPLPAPPRNRSTSHSSDDVHNSNQADLLITEVRSEATFPSSSAPPPPPLPPPSLPPTSVYHTQNTMQSSQGIYEAGEYLSLINSKMSSSMVGLNSTSMQNDIIVNNTQSQGHNPVTLSNEGQVFEETSPEQNDSVPSFSPSPASSISTPALSSITAYENKPLMPYDNRSLAKKVKRKYTSCRFCPICNTPQRNLHTHLERVHHLNRDARQEWLQREKMARMERRNVLVRRMVLPHVPTNLELQPRAQPVNENDHTSTMTN